MLDDIRETLVVNLLYEKEEGQTVRDTKSGPGVARQSRKQYKETAELIIGITEELEKGK